MEGIKESLKTIIDYSQDHKTATCTLAAVGALVVGNELLKWTYAAYKYLIRPSYNLKRRYGENWAVVTGASDGIGKG